MKIGFLRISLEREKTSEQDLERKVRFVPDSVNSWRIFWAD